MPNFGEQAQPRKVEVNEDKIDSLKDAVISNAYQVYLPAHRSNRNIEDVDNLVTGIEAMVKEYKTQNFIDLNIWNTDIFELFGEAFLDDDDRTRVKRGANEDITDMVHSGLTKLFETLEGSKSKMPSKATH
jgi:hypothetical protein